MMELHNNGWHEMLDTANNLYGGGWRSGDRALLIAEYGVTEEYADMICEILAEFEDEPVYIPNICEVISELVLEIEDDTETISETTYREYPGEIDMDYMDIKDRNMNAQDMEVRM